MRMMNIFELGLESCEIVDQTLKKETIITTATTTAVIIMTQI